MSVALGGALVVAAMLGPAAAASADSSPNDVVSGWWYDKYNVGAAQAAGWNGSGINIGVVDGQINSSLSVFQGADLTVHEPGICGVPSATVDANEASVHGSDVTALLVGNGTGPGNVRGIAPKAHVTFYGNINSSGTPNCTADMGGQPYSAIGLGIREALADDNQIITISQGGASSYQRGDIEAIAQAIARGVVVLVADANDPGTKGGFPQTAEGIVAVNAIKQDGTLQTFNGETTSWADTTVVAAGWNFPSQAGGDPLQWGSGDAGYGGASFATPLVAGMLALTLEKYPSVSGNQLLQSLIHNTGVDDHSLDLENDGYGYGIASLTHLLRVDPSQYPDSNPLMDKQGGSGKPTAADVAKAADVGPSPSPSHASGAAAGAPRPDSSVLGGLVPALIVVGLIVLLVVVGVVVVLIVVLTRRGRRTVGG